MINFGGVTKENIKEQNPVWPQVPDRPYRLLIIRGSGSGKANTLLNHEIVIDQIFWCVKDRCEAKQKLLVNKRESTGTKYLNDSKAFIAFIEYSNDMDDIYKNIEEQNPNKKRKTLIAFDDIMFSNKKT